jgi:hypothetical protein
MSKIDARDRPTAAGVVFNDDVAHSLLRRLETSRAAMSATPLPTSVQQGESAALDNSRRHNGRRRAADGIAALVDRRHPRF